MDTPSVKIIHPEQITFAVEFYPSIDDQVHVSTRIGRAVKKTWMTYLYDLFLILNAVVFPVFLIFNDNLLVGLAVFGANLLVVMFLVPKVNADAGRKFYEKIYGEREKHLARAELSDEGLLYTADGCYSFFTWRRIDLIEETEEAIFFYLDGNGFGIRKNGFPYREQQNAFVEFAYAQVRAARSARLTS